MREREIVFVRPGRERDLESRLRELGHGGNHANGRDDLSHNRNGVFRLARRQRPNDYRGDVEHDRCCGTVQRTNKNGEQILVSHIALLVGDK